MEEGNWLCEGFEASRRRLHAVAYRMLGSVSDAEDAVQETWLKLSRADVREVQNTAAWLTTVIARVCLDKLRARRVHREDPLAAAADIPGDESPAAEIALADAIGPALLVVLDSLDPAERVAFVLHDMFDLSFDEIAPIVDRTPSAARQLASRARRRLRGAAAPAPDLPRQRELVSAFLAASRDGDFERLVSVLSSDVVLRADDLAVRMSAARQARGAPSLAREVRGAAHVAAAFQGRARAAQAATINAEPGAVWAMSGKVLAAFVFTSDLGKITGIDIIMEPERLAALDVVIGAT